MTGKHQRARIKLQPDTVFQFKITLLDIQPAIWRRIQVTDCTLDKLHEHIQTSMGWTNSHLHEFDISGVRYGDPELLHDDLGDNDFENSRNVLLSEFFAKRHKGFRFYYTYDFGDGWEHEILLEEQLPAEPKKKYPLCIDGQRACPPEDCGGGMGYEELLEILTDPEHEEYADYNEWAGNFSPEKFSPTAATREMRHGLPDWRSME